MLMYGSLIRGFHVLVVWPMAELPQNSVCIS
jgi:hypothetical protein